MTELTATIEAIIFSSTEPVTPKHLSQVCEVSLEAVEAALIELGQALSSTGLRLSQHRDSYRLVSAPEATAAIARFHSQNLKHDLSRAALETLAIIAYRGPLSRHDIEEIRGVNSEQMVRNLLQRGLIEESGKSTDPGRPSLYAVTHLFLDTVGVTKIGELPPLPDEVSHEA